MFFKIHNWIVALVISIVFSVNASATEVEYTVAGVLTAYDNIRRVPEPVDNELGKTVRGTFAVYEDSASISGRFVSSIAAVKYQNGQAADETIGNVFSDATWSILPQKFEWYVSDTFTQTSIDPLVRDTPSNRQNINAFITGPNYIVRINKVNTLNFEVRAKDFQYEVNNADNERISVLGEWVYDINSSINISLNYEQEDVNFNNDIGNSDFDREDVYLELNYNKRKSDILLAYGETKVENDLGDFDKASTYIIDYRSARRQDANSHLVISRSVTDVSGDILNPVDEADFNKTAVNSDTYIDHTIRFTHTELYRSGSFTFYVYGSTNEYNEQVILDQEEKGLHLSTDWNYARNSRFRLQARFVNTIYDNLVPLRDDDDSFYRFLYTRTMRRDTRLNFELNSFSRRSTIDAEVYDDNRIIVSLEYVSI